MRKFSRYLPPELVISSHLRFLAVFCFLLAPCFAVALAVSTPLRLSVLDGDAAIRHAGADTWDPLEANFPVAEGDQLALQPGSRVELEIGHRAALRLDAGADVSVQSVRPLHFELHHGSAIVRTGAEEVQLTTPGGTYAFRPSGRYRLNVNEASDELIVFQGNVVLPDSAEIGNGRRATLDNGKVVSEEYYQSTKADLFQLWSDRRDSVYAFGRSAEYLPASAPGGETDLDHYGTWQDSSSYGYAWYPRVSFGWLPYRIGHWYFSPHFGWTWISAEPWGWLPYHYGRWAFTPGGWCWVPGNASYFSAWSPALVFFLRNNSHIGWFPIGPGDMLSAGRNLPRHSGPRGDNWGAPGGLVTQPIDGFSRGLSVAQSVPVADWNLGGARIASNVSDIHPVRPNTGNTWLVSRRSGSPVASPGNPRSPSSAVPGAATPLVVGGANSFVVPRSAPAVIPQEGGSRIVIPQDGNSRIVNPQDGRSRVVNPQDGGSRVVIPRHEFPSSLDRPIWVPHSGPGRQSAPANSRPIWGPPPSGSPTHESHSTPHRESGSSGGHNRRK
jgi:hypothetical protein